MIQSRDMAVEPAKEYCVQCGGTVCQRPTLTEYHDQEIYLFDPIVCEKCLLNFCERYSVPCGNCGGTIPPFTQVGVLKGDDGTRQFIHMTAQCSSVGSAFHGYLGKGELRHFIQIEAC